MEISKEQIAQIQRMFGRTVALCERLSKGLKKKVRLDEWEKEAITSHSQMVLDCNKLNWMLNTLKAVPIIDLESEKVESLPPPSAPASIDEVEDEQKFCDHCKKHYIDGKFDTICDSCHLLVEEEAKAVIQRKLARVAELQARKDKNSTEISQATKQTLADLKEQVELLESVGYANLDQKGKQSLTRFKRRIADLEADSASVA